MGWTRSMYSNSATLIHIKFYETKNYQQYTETYIADIAESICFKPLAPGQGHSSPHSSWYPSEHWRSTCHCNQLWTVTSKDLGVERLVVWIPAQMGYDPWGYRITFMSTGLWVHLSWIWEICLASCSLVSWNFQLRKIILHVYIYRSIFNNYYYKFCLFEHWYWTLQFLLHKVHELLRFGKRRFLSRLQRKYWCMMVHAVKVWFRYHIAYSSIIPQLHFGFIDPQEHFDLQDKDLPSQPLSKERSTVARIWFPQHLRRERAHLNRQYW